MFVMMGTRRVFSMFATALRALGIRFCFARFPAFTTSIISVRAPDLDARDPALDRSPGVVTQPRRELLCRHRSPRVLALGASPQHADQILHVPRQERDGPSEVG